MKNIILIDGIIFNLQNGAHHGISRVWKCLLEQIAKSDLAEDIILLDRNETAPKISGIRRRAVPAHNYSRSESDPLSVNHWPQDENAALFISTYYTWARDTPSLLMIHDMIPEVLEFDLMQPQWRAKKNAINNSIGILCVSNSSAADLSRFYPDIDKSKIIITPNAVGDEIQWTTKQLSLNFRRKFNIYKNYFLVVGHRNLYKNTSLFLKSFIKLPNRNDLEILFVGGAPTLEPELATLIQGLNWKLMRLSDSDLSAAYSSAIALVYPSRYEGFGLPILEAQKCRCPVITCHNSSLHEVAGSAALYVNDVKEFEMVEALMKIQNPSVREFLANEGSLNIKRFSWEKTGETLVKALKYFRDT